MSALTVLLAASLVCAAPRTNAHGQPEVGPVRIELACWGQSPVWAKGYITHKSSPTIWQGWWPRVRLEALASAGIGSRVVLPGERCMFPDTASIAAQELPRQRAYRARACDGDTCSKWGAWVGLP